MHGEYNIVYKYIVIQMLWMWQEGTEGNAACIGKRVAVNEVVNVSKFVAFILH
jgi:hypothetical protein